ncbi:MAG TPA: hypothetical protein VND54_11665 [Candidatus Saccharimonadales bacterium]|nr:hypothetical protein [Candidatus Saccharimonadales bacterium]
MLLDIGSVLAGIGLAVVAFLVVILVCVVILRLLAAILPSYEDRDVEAAPDGPASSDEGTPSSPTQVAGGDEERQN